MADEENLRQQAAGQGVAPPPVTVEINPATAKAVALAASDSDEALARLGQHLVDVAYLAALNTEQEYLALNADRLQLYFILQALAQNRNSSANVVFGEVSAGRPFQYPGPNLAALLEASRLVHEPPEGLLSVWRSQLTPESSELHRTVDVLVDNGSAPALGLLADVLLDPEFREDFLVVWFRDSILRHRQDEHLLEMCRSLLENPGWPKRKKALLLSVLFDYNPEGWYAIDVDPPEPPDPAGISEKSRALLEVIAGIAREQGL